MLVTILSRLSHYVGTISVSVRSILFGSGKLSRPTLDVSLIDVLRGVKKEDCFRCPSAIHAITQHSLPGGLLGLTWAGLTPADRASFAGAFAHSITSSAVICMISGTVRPSAFAVLRLMTSSNLVGCMTGRSAGFSPLRIRPT